MLIPGLTELALALTLASAQAPVPYHNTRYGFALSPPRGHMLCVDGPPRPNRGAFLLLSTPNACPDVVPADALYISVSASYNALEYRSLNEAVDKRCPKLAVRSYDAKDLRFSNLPAATCRYAERPGHARVDVLAFRKERKDKRLGRNPDDWILFEASLVTTPQRLQQDLATFKAVLAGIRFSPAP
jgi:hypothetical protein